MDQSFLDDFGFCDTKPIKKHYVNLITIYITNSLVFFELTKHFKGDCCVICDAIPRLKSK